MGVLANSCIQLNKLYSNILSCKLHLLKCVVQGVLALFQARTTELETICETSKFGIATLRMRGVTP